MFVGGDGPETAEPASSGGGADLYDIGPGNEDYEFVYGDLAGHPNGVTNQFHWPSSFVMFDEETQLEDAALLSISSQRSSDGKFLTDIWGTVTGDQTQERNVQDGS